MRRFVRKLRNVVTSDQLLGKANRVWGIDSENFVPISNPYSVRRQGKQISDWLSISVEVGIFETRTLFQEN